MRVVTLDGQPRVIRTLTANVSSKGMFVRMPEPLPTGTRVALSLEAGGRALALAQAEVVWQRLNESELPGRFPGCGVRFTDFLHPRAQELVDYLVDNLDRGKPLTAAPPQRQIPRWIPAVAISSLAVVAMAAILIFFSPSAADTDPLQSPSPPAGERGDVLGDEGTSPDEDGNLREPAEDAASGAAKSTQPVGVDMKVAAARSADGLDGADTSGADVKGTDVKGTDVKGADGRGADAKSAEVNSAEVNSADGRGADAKSAEAKSADGRGADAKSAEVNSAEVNSADGRGADAKSAEVNSADGRGADAKSAEAKSADGRGADAKSAEVKSAEVNSADGRGADAKSAEAKSADGRGADAKSADVKSAQVKMADMKGDDVKGSAQLAAKAVDASRSRQGHPSPPPGERETRRSGTVALPSGAAKTLKWKSDGSTVRLDPDATLVRAFVLDGPPRAVFDLEGAAPMGSHSMPTTIPHAKSVRIGKQGKGTRVVVDLDQSPTSSKQTGGELVLSF